MLDKDPKNKAKIHKDGRSVDYSREEIESYLPNLVEELSSNQNPPIQIPTTTQYKEPRTPDQVKESLRSQYDPDSELFNPKTEDYLRRCSTLEEAKEIILFQLKIKEITNDQADKYLNLCEKHGVRYFGQKKEWGYYERTYRKKTSSV
jgi:hypothetical protein